jgi:dynein light intermediate chain 1
VGWDSWGKIGVLREGFDCRGWGDAWDYDLDSQTAENPSGATIMFKKLVGSDDRVRVKELFTLKCKNHILRSEYRNPVYRR